MLPQTSTWLLSVYLLGFLIALDAIYMAQELLVFVLLRPSVYAVVNSASG